MKFAFFCHSIASDWNHGNAHFLRGVVRELQAQGHEVRVHEPEDGWSRTQLLIDRPSALLEFARTFPEIDARTYRLETLDVAAVVRENDVVVVHEWSDPELVRRIGASRRESPRTVLLFHDTHHRMVSDPAAMAELDLSAYDGVLAFGCALRQVYEERAIARRVWIWHEAADVRLFRPLPAPARRDDLVWIGNWGDGERAEELEEFLLAPVRDLGLRAAVHGVRYPPEALRALAHAGIEYKGYLPNAQVPEVFARHRVTVHVPRRPYQRMLPGIPTIRPFEALACGIPFVSAPWHDAENLFREGRDHLRAGDRYEMREALRRVLADETLAASLARRGLATIRRSHTCARRARELCAIVESLQPEPALPRAEALAASEPRRGARDAKKKVREA